jgi:hypothetical protein
MIAYPVSRYLVQFGVDEEAVVAEDLDIMLQPLSTTAEDQIEFREAELEAARDEGRKQALATAQTHLETSLQALNAQHAQHLVTERQSWAAEESDKLSSALTEALAQLQDMLANAVDAILRPFLLDTLRHQMVDELAHNVHILLTSENPVIEISGSADLIADLRAKLSSETAVIDYKPNSSSDVRIVAHQTVIQSQMQAWIERFESPREQA